MVFGYQPVQTIAETCLRRKQEGPIFRANMRLEARKKLQRRAGRTLLFVQAARAARPGHTCGNLRACSSRCENRKKQYKRSQRFDLSGTATWESGKSGNHSKTKNHPHASGSLSPIPPPILTLSNSPEWKVESDCFIYI